MAAVAELKRSEGVGSPLHEALLAFQEEAPTLPKDATNPHFRSKFTSLETIVERIKPLLVKHGLTWTTMPTVDPITQQPALRYRLSHPSSGEWIEDTMPLLMTKQDPQGQGSAITYARRYSICAVLNLVADEDDDGNQASSPVQQADPLDRLKGLARYTFAAMANLSPKDDKPDKAKFTALLDSATTVGEVEALMVPLRARLTEVGGNPVDVEKAFDRKESR